MPRARTRSPRVWIAAAITVLSVAVAAALWRPSGVDPRPASTPTAASASAPSPAEVTEIQPDASGLALPKSIGSLRFAVMGDVGRGDRAQYDTANEMARWRGRFEFQMRSDGTCVVGPAVRGKKEFVGGAPFVGREAELSQMMAAYEHSAEDRTPVIVTVTGPPGMGKTRLRRETISRIASHPSAPRIVLARCETFSKSHTLGLVADVARGFAGLAKGASLEDALDDRKDRDYPDECEGAGAGNQQHADAEQHGEHTARD